MEPKGTLRSPALVIIFSIITCGIYALVWIYMFANELKQYLEKPEINPGLDLILCIICFPYLYYWAYKYGQLIKEAQKKANIEVEDNSVLYVIIAVLGFFIVDMAIMQSSVNKVWSKNL